jgi:hypothetical protein
MHAITLDSLELTPEELERSREAIRNSAHRKWLDAGCPRCDDLEFWLSAERDWIEHCYVPHRRRDNEAALLP